MPLRYVAPEMFPGNDTAYQSEPSGAGSVYIVVIELIAMSRMYDTPSLSLHVKIRRVLVFSTPAVIIRSGAPCTKCVLFTPLPEYSVKS